MYACVTVHAPCMCVVRGQHAELPLPLYSGFQGFNSSLQCLQQVLGLDVGLFLPSEMKGREGVWERQWSRLSLSRRCQKRILLQQRLLGQAAVQGWTGTFRWPGGDSHVAVVELSQTPVQVFTGPWWYSHTSQLSPLTWEVGRLLLVSSF